MFSFFKFQSNKVDQQTLSKLEQYFPQKKYRTQLLNSISQKLAQENNGYADFAAQKLVDLNFNLSNYKKTDQKLADMENLKPPADTLQYHQVRHWFNQKTQTSQDIAQLIYSTKKKAGELSIFRYFLSPRETYRNHYIQKIALELREEQHEKRNSHNKDDKNAWNETILKYMRYAQYLYRQRISKKSAKDEAIAENLLEPYAVLQKYTQELEQDTFKLKPHDKHNINKQIDRLMDALTQEFHQKNLDTTRNTPRLDEPDVDSVDSILTLV